MNENEIREGVLPYGLQPVVWEGSFNGRECSLHQLAPYVGKLKSGMVLALLQEFSRPGDLVLDPFAGSGVVPLEALIHNRRAYANDLSEYAYAVTLGKLAAPGSHLEARAQTERVLDYSCAHAGDFALSQCPDWVREFFHPRTLAETLAAFEACNRMGLHFVRACLLGILHHVRPGFLSFPASHLTPYLRTKRYPPSIYPHMYQYRELASRLRAKVDRAYRRPPPRAWSESEYRVDKANAMSLPYDSESVDCIISSPPYFGALDYARDNRLRLWFLGVEDWRDLDRRLTASERTYIPQMRRCLHEMHRVLRPGRHCVLVLGDVERDGRKRETAEIISREAYDVTSGGLQTEQIVADAIPDERRSRRGTATTKQEKILVLRKVCRLCPSALGPGTRAAPHAARVL